MARRIFDMALQGKSTLDIAKTLNAEGIPTSNGKKWLKTTVHFLLTNEAYAGTVSGASCTFLAASSTAAIMSLAAT